MNQNNSQKNIDRFSLPDLSIHDLIGLLFFYKWIIILVPSFCAIASLYVTWSTVPTYVSSADILIEDQSKAETILQFSSDDTNEISNELEILRSRSLAEQVVKELWKSNHRNRLFLFDSKVFYPKGQRIREQLKKIVSFGYWAHELKAPQKHNEEFDSNIARRYSGRLRDNLSVSNKRGTKIINISYQSPSPTESALIANTVAVVYKRSDKQWINEEKSNLVEFLSQQIKLKKQELELSEQELKEFKRDNKIFSLDASSTILYNQTVEIERELNNTIAQRNINNKQIEFTKNKLTAEEKELAKSLTNSLNASLQAVRSEISGYESELVKNISIYGDRHEAVSIIRKKINELKDKLNKQTSELISQGLSVKDPIEYRQSLITKLVSIETENKYLNAKINEFDNLLLTYDNKLISLPNLQMIFAGIEREYLVLSETYKFMRGKLEEAKIANASGSGKVRLVDDALPSRSPVSPSLVRNLFFGIFFGLFFSVIGIYIREFMDSTVKSIDYIERFSIPLLAVIPSIGQVKDKTKRKKEKKDGSFNILNGARKLDNLQRRLITYENPKSPVSEAYRHLRTSLLYSDINKSSKQNTIMISSPGPGEGKTTTIINLAITFANLGKKTVLIDSDLRKPVLHKVFNTEKDKGLTHYLCNDDVIIEDIAKNTEIENLSLITCGAIPPNPSELLASDEMENLIEKLKSRYDIILLDAPPIMAVTDSILLSKYVSKFILVVRVGVTVKGGTERSIESLNQVNTKITGVVMNALDFNNSYYYSNYYYYQNYYYASE